MSFEATTTSAVTYGDWIFVNSIIIFFLSFIVIGLFMSLFPKQS